MTRPQTSRFQTPMSTFHPYPSYSTHLLAMGCRGCRNYGPLYWESRAMKDSLPCKSGGCQNVAFLLISTDINSANSAERGQNVAFWLISTDINSAILVFTFAVHSRWFFPFPPRETERYVTVNLNFTLDLLTFVSPSNKFRSCQGVECQETNTLWSVWRKGRRVVIVFVLWCVFFIGDIVAVSRALADFCVCLFFELLIDTTSELM